MTTPPQITEAHLSRKAIAYIRQSSPDQVRENVGSTAVQRDLPSQLVDLGWTPDQIEVFDEDLGITGSIPGHRQGFELLLQRLASGLVGAVAVVDSSRLGRNYPDSVRFMEVARAANVLLVAGSQIINFSDANSAFVAAVLAANAARENQARVEMSKQARRKKAELGLATTPPPKGYISLKGDWLKDPGPQVRDVVQLVFDKFVELGSGGALIRYFRRHDIQLPGRLIRARPGWVPASRGELYRILKNPAYAGVYIYGKTRNDGTYTRSGRPKQHKNAPSQQVIVKEHHEAYVSLAVWTQIQQRLSMAQSVLRIPTGRGAAFVQGLLRCSIHKRAFVTWYRARGVPPGGTRRGAYWCHELTVTGKSTPCARIAAGVLDPLIEVEVLATLVPPSLDSLRDAARGALREYEAIVRARDDELRRCDQAIAEAERAFDQTDPRQIRARNRFVERLDHAIRTRDDTRARHALHPLHPPLALDAGELAELQQMVQDLPTLWRHPDVTWQQRKAVAKTMIRGIHATPDPEVWTVTIEWIGGEKTTLEVLTDAAIRSRVKAAFAAGKSVPAITTLLQRLGAVMRVGRAAGRPYTERNVRRLLKGLGLGHARSL